MSLSSLLRCRWRFVVEGVRHEAIQVERHAWKMSHVNTSPILETRYCVIIPALNVNINVQLVIIMSCKAIVIHVSAIRIACAKHTTAVGSFCRCRTTVAAGTNQTASSFYVTRSIEGGLLLRSTTDSAQGLLHQFDAQILLKEDR